VEGTFGIDWSSPRILIIIIIIIIIVIIIIIIWTSQNYLSGTSRSS